jgi:protein tyrosine phosphatase (PTP) superfamily phosphohydrolase (DUF442 family)
MPDSSLTSILNYLELPVQGFPRLGTAGQPTIEQYPAIRDAGFATVINLATEKSTGALADEAAVAAGLGLEYVHIPVIWEAPTLEDLQQFFAALQARRGKPVFVHCALNMRASAFLYLYRVLVDGMDEETARWDMLSIWEPEGVWAELIEQALRH